MPPAAHSHFQLNPRGLGMQALQNYGVYFVISIFFPPKETYGTEDPPDNMVGLTSLQAGARRLTCGSPGSRVRGICSGTPPAQTPRSGKGKGRFTTSLRS